MVRIIYILQFIIIIASSRFLKPILRLWWPRVLIGRGMLIQKNLNLLWTEEVLWGESWRGARLGVWWRWLDDASSLIWLIDCLVSFLFLLFFLYSFHLPGSAMVRNASGTTQFLWGDVYGRISWTKACAFFKSALVVVEFCSQIEIFILGLGISIHHFAA